MLIKKKETGFYLTPPFEVKSVLSFDPVLLSFIFLYHRISIEAFNLFPRRRFLYYRPMSLKISLTFYCPLTFVR